MPGDHRPLRRAVIDEHAGARRLEAQRHFLARIDVGELAAAEPAGRGVEVDVVVECVGRRIDEGELEIVAFVDDHQRPGDRAVVGEGVDLRAVVVDHVLLLDDRHLEGDDLRSAAGRLLVRRGRKAARRARLRGAADRRPLRAIAGSAFSTAAAPAAAPAARNRSRRLNMVGSWMFVVSSGFIAQARPPERCWPSMFRRVCRSLRDSP